MNQTYFKIHLGNLIKEKAEAAGISILQLGQIWGLHQRTVRKSLLRGELEAKKLRQLSVALGEDLMYSLISQESSDRVKALEAEVEQLKQELRIQRSRDVA